MARSTVASKRSIESKPKVKTGCTTCRIRKIKCDENKPFCQRCLCTGRTCDGYESPFRSCKISHIKKGRSDSTKLIGGVQALRPATIEITPQDIDLLNRYFSTKTMFDIDLGCNEEARQILQASLTDPPVRNAVLSLRALREDLETFGDGPASAVQQTQSYYYGLEQYNMALGGLASNLSHPTPNGLKSALLCCQIFISIEQVRKNWAAMAQHIIRGLRIMHEYRARPCFVAANKLVPAYHDQLPFLDVFIIKLFAAPCKFADPSASADVSRTTSPACPFPPDRQLTESCNLRAIAPNMRTELTRIAMSTLGLLDKVSKVESVQGAIQLLSEKAALLDSLESWPTDLELIQAEDTRSGCEPISVSFLRLFHLILKTVLLGTLESSPALYANLQTENTRLQDLANEVGERLKSYVTCSGTSSG